MRKASLLLLPLALVAASCGGASVSTEINWNPFDSRYEITIQEASQLAENWLVALDQTATYQANVNYLSVAHDYYDDDRIRDEAHFSSTGSYSSNDYYYSAGYSFSAYDDYGNSYSYVSYIGRGLGLVREAIQSYNSNNSIDLRFYRNGQNFMFFHKQRNPSYNSWYAYYFYTIVEMDQNGLCSFYERAETQSDYYNAWIIRSTFTKVM